MVNLEVVRSRLARGRSTIALRDDLLSFAEQAASQAEAASKLSEGVGALLSLLAASVDETGRVRCTKGGDGSTIEFDVDKATAERLLPRLAALGVQAGFTAENDSGAVILSFPKTTVKNLTNINESAEDSHR